jgi:ankyrin repeat protein
MRIDNNNHNLLHACGNDAEVVKLLHAAGVDPNTKGGFGLTPLSLALHGHFFSKCLSLIDLPNTDVNAQDASGLVALHLVRSPIVAARLLEHPLIKPNIQDKNGDTPLSTAISYLGDNGLEFRITIIRQLLAHPDIDPNVVNNQGNTPLHLAVAASVDFTVIRAMVLHPKTKVDIPNNKGQIAIELANPTTKDGQAIIQLIRDKRIGNVEQYGNDPRAIVATSATGTANLAVPNKTLHAIMRAGQLHANQNLLSDAEVDVNAREAATGFTALHLVEWPPFNSALLQRKEIDPNIQCFQKGETPLIRAITYNSNTGKDLNIIAALVQDPRTDLTIKDHSGKTARQHAMALNDTSRGSAICTIIDNELIKRAQAEAALIAQMQIPGPAMTPTRDAQLMQAANEARFAPASVTPIEAARRSEETASVDAATPGNTLVPQ